MKKLLLLILLFPVMLTATSDNVDELFKEGNEKYKKGKYNDAIKYYELILSKGIRNGYVYYNLGNAYFKANNPGKAVLNLERAKIYLPSDADVNFNIRFTESRIVDTIQKQQYNPFTIVILFFYNLFEINTLFWVIFILFLILIGSLTFKWFYNIRLFKK